MMRYGNIYEYNCISIIKVIIFLDGRYFLYWFVNKCKVKLVNMKLNVVKRNVCEDGLVFVEFICEIRLNLLFF